MPAVAVCSRKVFLTDSRSCVNRWSASFCISLGMADISEEYWGPISGGYTPMRSEEHTSELQSLMRISYAVLCLKKKKRTYPYTIVTIRRLHKKYRHSIV